MSARLTVPAPTLELTESDRQLIADARQAFRCDYRYLEQLLWSARARRSPETGKNSTIAAATSTGAAH